MSTADIWSQDIAEEGTVGMVAGELGLERGLSRYSTVGKTTRYRRPLSNPACAQDPFGYRVLILGPQTSLDCGEGGDRTVRWSAECGKGWMAMEGSETRHALTWSCRTSLCWEVGAGLGDCLFMYMVVGGEGEAPGKSGVHVHGEGERVIALESW